MTRSADNPTAGAKGMKAAPGVFTLDTVNCVNLLSHSDSVR